MSFKTTEKKYALPECLNSGVKTRVLSPSSFLSVTRDGSASFSVTSSVLYVYSFTMAGSKYSNSSPLSMLWSLTGTLTKTGGPSGGMGPTETEIWYGVSSFVFLSLTTS